MSKKKRGPHSKGSHGNAPTDSIEDLFRKVVQSLNDAHATYALAGGIAVSLYRRDKRTTDDIDFLLFSENKTEQLATNIISSFGLNPGYARKADLEGGPLFAIKKKSTPVYMVEGRNKDYPGAIGLDFMMPPLPWFANALERAQSNNIDFGFGKVPTLTVEDMILAKFLAYQNDQKRFKDLDDLQSIFEKEQDVDYSYLTGQMLALHLPVPEPLMDTAPKMLQETTKEMKQRRKRK